MNKKQKLELTWIGKEHRAKLEPRILVEDPTKSYHAKQRVSDNDIFDNRLIFGDNLLALRALEQEFAGKIKCIFIDPPYNTGSAFTHYDDGVEHSIWLSLMRERLELLNRLLSDDGSFWITIDDNESHYLRVLCDEIFGRLSFVATVVWQKVYNPDARASISRSQDYIHIYAKDPNRWRLVRNLTQRSPAQLSRYKNPDNDPRGRWKPGDSTVQAGHGTSAQFYDLTLPSKKVVRPSSGRCWLYTKSRYEELLADNRIWFGAKGSSKPQIKQFLSEVQNGVVPSTWWPFNEVGHNQEAKQEIVDLFPDQEPFATPKPERLLERIIRIATNPGDLILDSFLGSGTTAAVAHKMGRRWIGIELGDHCHSHCIPRLTKVVDGNDPGGITEAVEWKGGGGFRYYRLAPSLLSQDKWGQWVISQEYNAPMLAEAVCKLEGFVYAPSDTLYWQHGHSTERDFIYTTTSSLSHDQLQQLSDEVGAERSLLIVCSAFRGRKEGYTNLTVKKIPKAVLARCEWGKDDYSLNVENLPKAPGEVSQGIKAGGIL
jgi:adenine-specific DNA-methyltransferase